MQGAGDDDVVKASELVAGKVVAGCPALRAVVSAVLARVNGAHGHYEAHPVGRGDFAPGLGQGEPGWAVPQAGVGGSERFHLDVPRTNAAASGPADLA